MTTATTQPGLNSPISPLRAVSTVAGKLVLGLARGVGLAVALHVLAGAGLLLVILHGLGLLNLTVAGIAATGAVLLVHLACAPFVLSASGTMSAAGTVRRAELGRLLVTAALERAAQADPRLRESNDVPRIAAGIQAAISAMAGDAKDECRGVLSVLRRQVVGRVIRLVGWAALHQLDLLPRADGTYSFARVEDWLGSRIDAAAAAKVRGGAVRMLGLVLGLQVVVTTVILAALVSSSGPQPPDQHPPTSSEQITYALPTLS
jgi:hypothetical protein